eukprot:TRINITY_DN6992_c0_g1_i1.p1 TRINITY_DN6992_c0_g1~~TRINITY_DN6992_c0_g1_i1.p1  ORF type:complete len:288 (+),score=54.55 TRINITY_DN6992_c0_g1_i1:399-1262(+)
MHATGCTGLQRGVQENFNLELGELLNLSYADALDAGKETPLQMASSDVRREPLKVLPRGIANTDFSGELERWQHLAQRLHTVFQDTAADLQEGGNAFHFVHENYLAVGANVNLSGAENWWYLGKRMHGIFEDCMSDPMEEEGACLDVMPEGLISHTGSAEQNFSEAETWPRRRRQVGRISKDFASGFHADYHDLGDGHASPTCRTMQVDDNLDYVCRNLPPSDLAFNGALIQIENWWCLGERVLIVLKHWLQSSEIRAMTLPLCLNSVSNTLAVLVTFYIGLRAGHK